MMGLDEIRANQMEAASRAAQEDMVPFVYEPDDVPSGQFPFPELGDYEPPGWNLSERWFVDAMGMGGAGEPAMTHTRLLQEIEKARALDPEVGFGIVEVGQFQLYVGVYHRDDVPVCDYCDKPQGESTDWNGETGCHISCESQYTRPIESVWGAED